MLKKSVVLGVLVLSLSSVAFAQAKPKQKTPAVPKEIACAVMPAMKVNVKDATKKKMYSDYKGRRYFFCCDGCPGMFKKEPAKYAKNPSIKTPKVKS